MLKFSQGLLLTSYLPVVLYFDCYIAVGENHTILDVSQSKLQLNNVIEAHTYAEAAGLILALKNNIHLESLSRPLMTLRP